MWLGRGRINPAFLPLTLALAASVVFGQSPAAHLDFAEKVAMVSCESVSAAPVFRIKFNILNAQGALAPVQLPAPDKLAENISIRVNDRSVIPFYAFAAGTSSGSQHRTALILVDVSGSMNVPLSSGQTRFEAAKAAIFSSLENFEEGTDRVAVVPFESHNVAPHIAGARFAATKLEAMAQVNALPLPTPKNNTAIYSAVVDGLDVLSRQTNSTESMLVLMTDGKNEILSGDDPGLLDGPSGLDFAGEKVRNSGVQVVGVGFGDPSQIDENALARVSTKHFMARDQDGLSKIFNVARVLLNSRVTAAFLSPWPDRASLASTTLHISAELKLASGSIISKEDQVWSTPQMGIPAYHGSCTPAEVLALSRGDVPGPNWMSILRPILIFAGLGALLLILWFWVPRLVWPDQYVGIIPTTHRWANTQSRTGASVRNAPAGFGLTKASSRPPRTPADATIVQPRPDFSKTRLDRDKYSG